jgi:hypothetical protein
MPDPPAMARAVLDCNRYPPSGRDERVLVDLAVAG